MHAVSSRKEARPRNQEERRQKEPWGVDALSTVPKSFANMFPRRIFKDRRDVVGGVFLAAPPYAYNVVETLPDSNK